MKEKKPNGYWNKERCQNEALKYNSKKEFQLNSGSSYSTAHKHNWINDICRHMIRPTSEKKIWTKDNCRVEALKYLSRTDFMRGSMGAYLAATRNKYLDEVCQHMVLLRKHWTKELCRIESLKFKNKQEFRRKQSGAYNYAHKNRFLNEICQHMTPTGNEYKRCIYAAEFNDGFVYIGLTYNFQRRIIQHLNCNNSGVYEHMTKYQLTPNFKQLCDYQDVSVAKKLEGEYVEIYTIEGWKVLNKAKTGAVGGNKRYWTKHLCKLVALKYSTRHEFKLKSSGVYSTAVKNKWLNDICVHMPSQRKK
jgi:predicted GIY-YIG superfamily endonuclease